MATAKHDGQIYLQNHETTLPHPRHRGFRSWGAAFSPVTWAYGQGRARMRETVSVVGLVAQIAVPAGAMA